MKYDRLGQPYFTSDNLCDLFYIDPSIDLSKFQVEDPTLYNKSVKELHLDFPLLTQYQANPDVDLETFDHNNQQHWLMPKEYQELDIAKWVLDRCKTQAELQRVGEELLLYQDRNLFPLLQYLKYLVDTLRANNVVWGVGRGSSVASYVLYLIGVHRINSLAYELEITEFLK